MTPVLRVDQLGPVTACLGLALLPHILTLPYWISALVVACAALCILRRGKKLLNTFWRAALAVIAAGLLLIEFRTFNGIAAGTALLALMAGLKLLEARTTRDLTIIVFIVYFLSLAALLGSNSLALLLYTMGLCLIATAVLLRISIVRDPPPFRQSLALTGRLFAHAAPLALGLWLFFPRFASPLWQLPSDETAASGLSDSMSPGDISELSLSDSPAFRILYRGAPPPPRQRYFRGPVLFDFDGRTWRRTAPNAVFDAPMTASGAAASYVVKLEPHRHRWIFALDWASSWNLAGAHLSADHMLEAASPITAPIDVDIASSATAIFHGPLSLTLRHRDTRRPAGRNLRTSQWAQALRAAHPDDLDYISVVLERFRSDGFTYTLMPPRLGADSVDEFLFDTKRGFCGHFASAFADVMRAAGIPAHVVTGYQGGTFNRFAGYWIVRQSDAHAWDEVWIEGRGWQRFDPTAVVAPDRIERGLAAALGADEPVPGRMYAWAPWLVDLRQGADAIREFWRDAVLRFDAQKQDALLQSLGFAAPDARTLGLALAAALALASLWIVWQTRRETAIRPRDRLGSSYADLQRRLARAGWARKVHEGPLAYARRVAGARPDLADELERLCTRYAELRYGLAPTPAQIDALSAQMAAFRVRAIKPKLPPQTAR